MVDVLARHPGQIHSFVELRDRVPCTRVDPARSSFCSPAGDYCTAIAIERGATLLSLRSFVHRGRVRVCVTPPTGRESCRRFRLRQLPRQGPWASEVRWGSHFPERGKGAYRVRWEHELPVGPPLVFER